MKKYYYSFITAVALILAVTGCGTVGQKADGVLLVQTSPAVTNAVTGAITPPVYGVNPTIQNGIATAQGFAGYVPAPYNVPVEAGLGLLVGGLALYARYRNGQLSKTTQVLKAVVAGVEAAGHADTKASIQNAAAAAGVQEHLDPIVQKVSPQVISPPSSS